MDQVSGSNGDGPRHELHILQGLALRLGLAEALAGSIDDWKRRLLTRLEPAGVDLPRLRVGAARNPFAEPVLFADGREKDVVSAILALQDEVTLDNLDQQIPRLQRIARVCIFQGEGYMEIEKPS